MSTTIDSLQIEIQTSSSNAAVDIDKLAVSLERLKKVGSFNVAVKNLNNLSTALKNLQGASSAGDKLQNLATAISTLKSAGSFGSIATSFKKLGESVKGLKSADIDHFVSKVKELNDKLGPVSTKLVSIGSAIKAVKNTSKSAGDSIHVLGKNVNVTTLNMASLTTVAQGLISSLRPVITLISNSISAAIEWDGINYQFGNTFGEQADLYYEKITQITDALKLNKQTFMENSAMASSMLIGFGVNRSDAREMGVGYTELAYDIWAAFNNVYKSFDGADGAMAAVRSAISGEVEPIRRAGFTIVDSQLKITAANHGVAYSSDKATEAQKSYLRYLTLVDQAASKGIIGAYAHEMSTAEGQMRTFSQQLKSLSQTFGSVFLPVLTQVMPWLQAIVELLGEAITAVAAFFGVEIQKVDFGSSMDGVTDSADGATDALGKTTDAVKELENATLGIDEFNVLSPQSDNSGNNSSGSGSAWDGLDVESLWDESIFDNIQSEVDEIKESIKGWIPVIELAGIALGLLSASKLLSDLSTAIGKMDVLSKAIFGVGTALIEASLVFMFADNYLEEGSLLSLAGEAISTALGSYLLYKTWGDKGLVVGLAVSIAAQLVAITLNMADGSVKIDDPQLWIQSVFATALGGLAGGWLAYKGLIPVSTGKGIGLGLLAVASLTLSAITIGEITANGEVTAASIWTGLGAIAAAAGFGFMVGGPWGAVIGAGVALAVNVIGAIIGTVSKNAEKSLQADLESRFGNVELTVSEARVLVEKLLPEWVEGVDYAVQLRDGVNDMLKSIETQESTLGALEWQVSVGIALTESENKEYKKAIDSFILNCQNYITERGHAVEIGIKATSSNASIIESSNAVSAMAYKELEALGKELQDTVNSAYEDGLLDIDELEAIQTIRNDMREIVNALAGSEIDAELGVLKMKWSGVDLTPDSFQTMMNEWNDTIQNKVKPALESTVKENLKTLEGNVTYLKLALEKDPDNTQLQEELKKAEEALQSYINENPLENLTIDVNIEAVTFSLNTLQDAFAKEIARIESEGHLDFDNNLSFALEVYPDVKFDNGNGDIYGNWDILAQTMMLEMEEAADSMSETARKNLEKMLENMKPTMADIEGIAAANRKAGKAVPQSVREGINDYNELLAMSGDTNGMLYKIGQGFSTDPVFLNTLATVKNAGRSITGSMREGLLNNVEYVYDSASGVIVGIKDSINNETVYITPELKENLSQMGVNMGDALGGKYQYVYDETTGVLKSIVDSVTGNEVWVNGELEKAGKNAGSNLSSGVLAGAETSMESNKKSWLDWAIWPWNWFKEKNEIHSPSKLFERGGKHLTDGLKNGMETNSLRDKLSSIWSTAKTWWDKSKGVLSTYTPSIGDIKSKLSSAWSTAKSWWDKSKSALASYTPSIGSIKDKVSSAWTTAKNWWDKTKSSLATYTPSIGSIKDKVSSAWTTAKNWWNNNKGSLSYTPTVGSIKDKLSSAWTTAKTWWDKNVKLSIPSLSFKVTYTTSGLSTVKKAIVNALGLSGWPKLSFAANGGIFDMGSLVWAGEAGPEIVANAGGGKTGVMNVQQMSEAVYEGVYSAVVAAMRASNGNSGNAQAVNVYLDGKQIYGSMEQHRKERGASLMGNQVYSY